MIFFSVNGEKRVCCLSGRSTSVIKWSASCQIPLSLIKSRIILLIEVVLEKANRESYCYIWSQKHTHTGQMLHQPSVTKTRKSKGEKNEKLLSRRSDKCSRRANCPHNSHMWPLTLAVCPLMALRQNWRSKLIAG